MLAHEFICIRPEILEREEIDYPFFVKYRENTSVIPRWMVLPDEAVSENYGFKRQDFRISGMTEGNFYPELMKFFSSFVAHTPEGRKNIGLCYWGITLLTTQTLREMLQRAEIGEMQRKEEMLKFLEFCRAALNEGLWVVHFGV